MLNICLLNNILIQQIYIITTKYKYFINYIKTHYLEKEHKYFIVDWLVFEIVLHK